MILEMALSVALNQTKISEVADNIERLNPHVSIVRAKKLARIIAKEADRYDIDADILTAIIRQESNFEPEAKACYIVHRHKSCEVTCDLGVSQINRVWANKWAINEDDLVQDDALNIHVAARVLSILKKQFGDEPNYFSRYNTSGKNRPVYEASVQNFIEAIEE